MIRASTIITLIFFCASYVLAETISLSGTVMKAGSTTGIANVNIHLGKLPSLSATTSADGSFILAGSTSVQLQKQKFKSFNFTLKDNILIFSSSIQNFIGNIDFFSSDGKRKTSIQISDRTAGKSIALPMFISGINITRFTLNGESYISKVVCLSKAMFLKNEISRKNDSEIFTLSKQSAVAGMDSLIAEKKGYMSKKVAIDSYSKKDIIIMLDSAAGNPDGHSPIPAEAGLEDITHPDHVIGTGTPESCTSESFIAAVAQGGTIVFNCGSQPTTITLDKPAKIFNDAKPKVVIDGAGLITLSGGGKTRILYMNTCDSNQHWTTSHCQDQDNPKLILQNLTFTDGNSKNETEYDGGGAVWVRGGQLKIVNCRFFRNVCVDTGPDVGGAAVRVFSQYHNFPVYVVNSTFGGAEGYGNIGANGGGISSIGVSWNIINCLFSYNKALGKGGNPAQTGTPGGGSGGAIYNDGNTMTLSIFGTLIEHNTVNSYGSAIFFVTNDHTGSICIDTSIIRNNTGGSWYTLPGISMHDDTKKTITRSNIE